MGPEAEDIFSSFTWTTAGDKEKYDKVLLAFENHFIPVVRFQICHTVCKPCDRVTLYDFPAENQCHLGVTSLTYK